MRMKLQGLGLALLSLVLGAAQAQPVAAPKAKAAVPRAMTH